MGDSIHEVKTYLGMFGAPTWKPVILVSTDPCVEQLFRTHVLMFSMQPTLCLVIHRGTFPQRGTAACRNLDRSRFAKSDSTVVYRDSKGNKRFKGAGKKLKDTQVYPPAFGRAVLWHAGSTIGKPIESFMWCYGICSVAQVCTLYTTKAASPSWDCLVDHRPDAWEDAKSLEIMNGSCMHIYRACNISLHVFESFVYIYKQESCNKRS